MCKYFIRETRDLSQNRHKLDNKLFEESLNLQIFNETFAIFFSVTENSLKSQSVQ